MKKFNKSNCASCVRAQIVDQWGRTITLMGQHAFEWEIAIEGCTGNITIKQFPNGREACKHFSQLKRKR